MVTDEIDSQYQGVHGASNPAEGACDFTCVHSKIHTWQMEFKYYFIAFPYTYRLS